jgi:hypothetical protein
MSRPSSPSSSTMPRCSPTASRFAASIPGMAIKFYPSKYPTHFVITAALALRERIEHAACNTARCAFSRRTSTMPIVLSPRSGLEGKFSFQYTTTIALLDGKVGIHAFTDERRFAPDVVDLLGKCIVERDPAASNDTRSMRVEVQVTPGRRRDTLSQVCSTPARILGRAHRSGAAWGQAAGIVSARASRRRRIERDSRWLLDDLERASAADVGRIDAGFSPERGRRGQAMDRTTTRKLTGLRERTAIRGSSAGRRARGQGAHAEQHRGLARGFRHAPVRIVRRLAPTVASGSDRRACSARSRNDAGHGPPSSTAAMVRSLDMSDTYVMAAVSHPADALPAR